MGTRIGSHDHVTMVRGRKRARGVFSCGSFSQCFMSTWLLSQTISPNQVPIINAVFEGSGGGGGKDDFKTDTSVLHSEKTRKLRIKPFIFGHVQNDHPGRDTLQGAPLH